MKENNQKSQKKSWSIIIAVLSVCIIATAFFDYVNINLAGKIPILDQILGLAGVTEEYLKISPKELITHASSAQDILGELGIDGGGIFWKLGIFLFLPYVFAIVSAISGFFKKTSAEVVTAVSALLGIVILFVDYLLVIPRSIANALAEYKVSGLLKQVLNVDVEKTVRTAVAESFCPAFWICVALFAGIVVVSVARMFIEQKEEDDEDIEDLKPVLRCMFGKMKNMEIEMGESEILVGRDVRRCALIMTEAGVDNVHCMIRFNSESNDYGIVDISNTETCIFRNNDVDGEAIPLQKGVMCTVERGSWIAVGDRDNLLQLL